MILLRNVFISDTALIMIKLDDTFYPCTDEQVFIGVLLVGLARLYALTSFLGCEYGRGIFSLVVVVEKLAHQLFNIEQGENA